MNKRQLIDEIRRINATASPRYLERFDELTLRQYLDRLQTRSRDNIRIASRGKHQPKLRVVA